MKMNSHKLLFMSILLLSTLVTASSSNWLGMWMGLEMNLMSFIPLMSKSKNKKASQAMMIYFLTQSVGSVMLLFSVLSNSLALLEFVMINELSMIMIMISIMIKVGAAPFHFWLPEMMANLSWYECMVLMTWQKVAPLVVFNNIYPSNWFLYLSVMLSVIVGGVGGLNQTSLRKLLAYSSISHVGWMFTFVSVSYSWYKYLIIYSMLIIMICTMLNKKNIYFISQMTSSSSSLMENFTYTVLFLSIGGLPPFLGFLPKWMVLQEMINSNMYMLMLIILLFSLLPLFYYIRLMTSIMLSYSMVNKWAYSPPTNTWLLIMFLLVNMMLPMFMALGFV
uniref:NADH dehydrogenase subunit 2 n=1 Tax=Homoeocerus striicornis TaxID=2795333 RepID=UPI002A7FB102|nr:NADH dehydrogenase subunit 2 [Homoeocerus striicornis]WOZ13978.1 NADH dehydrogenase subunit 2 [Homoeocerus striicornis]